MAKVSKLLNPCLAKHIVDYSWQVEFPELMKREIPILVVIVRIEVLVVPRMAIAARIVHPHIKASISEIKRHRVGSIAADSSSGIEQSVLVKNHRLLFPQ